MLSPHTPIAARVCSSIKHVGALMVVLIAGSITGCQVQSAPPAPAAKPTAPGFTAEELEARRLQRFVEGMQGALRESILNANRQQLTGEVKLALVINRKNELISCEVMGTPQSTDAKAASELGALAKGACWSSVFPVVPAQYFNQDGIAEIRAPLTLPSLPDDQQQGLESRQLRFAQSQFFWARTLANQPPENIGVASFDYRANAQGEVQVCLVSLARTRALPESFKRDVNLQRRLTQQCKDLNLRSMPGFAVDETGFATGLVNVDYMPWRDGQKKR